MKNKLLLLSALLVLSCNNNTLESEIYEHDIQRDLFEALSKDLQIVNVSGAPDGYQIEFSDGTKISNITKNIDLILVGANGNWFINGKDTGVNAVSINGTTPKIEIGSNGNWHINGEETGVNTAVLNGSAIISIAWTKESVIFYFSDGTSIKFSYNPDFNTCYLSYNPIGSKSSLELFIVYVQNESNPHYYYGFEVGHEYNMDDIIYSDQYRLIKAPVYEYDGISMITIGENALMSGESEFAYRTPNKDDFTGGVHGDEKFTEINFFIDGVRMTNSELASSYSLFPCTEFSYLQKSTMHETARSNLANPLHPIEAIHYKNTVFKKSGYETSNKVKWEGDLSILTGYLSLSSISINFGGKGYVTDNSNIVTFNQGGDYKLSGLYNNVFMYNEELGNSSYVYSAFNTYDDVARQFIWDTPRYNKYYRNVGQQSVKNGEEWNSTTTVKFLKNKKITGRLIIINLPIGLSLMLRPTI